MVQIGEILLGKYRIERILGKGGMGVVVLAHHLQLDERVAIKFLLPDVMGNDQVVKRFQREAQAAVKLKSEHVCKVFDIGLLETGSPYIVMEYMEGADLGQMFTSQGFPPPPVAVDFILQACEALAEAHALGIVHRDLKPGNFFVTRRADGTSLLKVLDFGISKAPINAGEDLTQTNAMMGTPAYMAPEQMRSSKEVDARADIWALGVVLYHMLAGRRPFQGEVLTDLCIKIVTEEPMPLDAPIPGPLRDVVMRCLEKDPARRYQNVAELVAALAPFAADLARASLIVGRTSRILGLAAPPHGVGHGRAATGGPVATPSTVDTSSGQLVMPPVRGRSRIVAIVLAAAAVVGAGIALFVVLSGGDSPHGAGAVPADAAPAADASADERAFGIGALSADASVAAANDAATAASEKDATATVVNAPGVEADAGAAERPDERDEARVSRDKRRSSRSRRSRDRDRKREPSGRTGGETGGGDGLDLDSRQ